MHNYCNTSRLAQPHQTVWTLNDEAALHPFVWPSSKTWSRKSSKLDHDIDGCGSSSNSMRLIDRLISHPLPRATSKIRRERVPGKSLEKRTGTFVLDASSLDDRLCLAKLEDPFANSRYTILRGVDRRRTFSRSVLPVLPLMLISLFASALLLPQQIGTPSTVQLLVPTPTCISVLWFGKHEHSPPSSQQNSSRVQTHLAWTRRRNKKYHEFYKAIFDSWRKVLTLELSSVRFLNFKILIKFRDKTTNIYDCSNLVLLNPSRHAYIIVL